MVADVPPLLVVEFLHRVLDIFRYARADVCVFVWYVCLFGGGCYGGRLAR